MLTPRGHAAGRPAFARLLAGLGRKEKLQPLDEAVRGAGIN